MLSSRTLRWVLIPFISVSVASATLSTAVRPRVAGSCNTAADRSCWSDGFDIDTNYYTEFPSGTTREYDFVVSEHQNWLGPDGVVKEEVMLINGQFPGPVIYADWGDTIVVNLTNNLTINGTSMHWHGIRQYHSNLQDGANGATECPLAPGQTKTYTFQATQYGTTWFHSHFSAQYGDGVVGSMLINGPATANYDIDLGVFPISDYYYITEAQGVIYTQNNAAPPASNNILFNGTNINPTNPSLGEYAVVTLTPGKRHRLRLINPSLEHNYQVSLVGHQLEVIQTDFVPIVPVTVDSVFLGVGQRYDVIINATEATDNYWFNVTLSATGLCGSSDNSAPAAIFRYAGANDTLPTTQGTKPEDSLCSDANSWTPYLASNVNATAFTPTQAVKDNLPVELDMPPLSSTVQWFVNSSSMLIDWEYPILDYVLNQTAWPTDQNVVMVNETNAWSFWVIQNLSPIPHPMHLHGHDFYLLGRSDPLDVPLSLEELLTLLKLGELGSLTQVFNPATDIGLLNFENPVRRDVTILPALGYIVLAFLTDNPGNWLFHCHIAWHVSGGLAVDFVEQPGIQHSLIAAADLAAYQDVCDSWRTFYATDPIKQYDSGL
ncbi:multicopper oxidase [Xylariaceae sp. FL0255]|nr:multicopper oxidase [Xylariaceae sp. FL0255]